MTHTRPNTNIAASLNKTDGLDCACTAITNKCNSKHNRKWLLRQYLCVCVVFSLLRPRSSQLNCVNANLVKKRADLAKGARTPFQEVNSRQSCVKWLYIIFLSLSFYSDVNCCNAALSKLPGNCYAPGEKLQPSSHQHSGGFGTVLQMGRLTPRFPKQAEVERSVSPVAQLNAEMREGRLVRDVASHRGGPPADLISSS